MIRAGAVAKDGMVRNRGLKMVASRNKMCIRDRTGTVLNDDVGQATAAAEATKLYVEGSKVEQYYWVDYVKAVSYTHLDVYKRQLYDVGNSAFVLLIATLGPMFFNARAEAGGLSPVNYLAYWGYASSVVTVITAVLGPILGTLRCV